MPWNKGNRFIVLLGFIIMGLGCNRDVSKVTIEMIPDHGCAPLTVKLMGTAKTRAGMDITFRWTVGDRVHLQGSSVAHTFVTPGTYNIALTVAAETQAQTRVATLEVTRAPLPRQPGLYWQQGCTYRRLDAVEPEKVVKNLGKTTLRDLEQRIVGRELSTRELITHPLWRREHTYTAYVVSRDRFVRIRLDQFQALGVVIVGEEAHDLSLYRILPGPEPAPAQQGRIVMRMVDSWGLDNIEPELLPLTRTRVTPNVWRYMPEGQLPEGSYFIRLQRGDELTPEIYPLALIVPATK